MTLWKPVSRDKIAQRVARDIAPGSLINLGIGMPELVGNYLRSTDEILIHTENGIVGSGPIVQNSIQDFDLINAGRKPVSLVQGGHFVDHVDSFTLVRGGHLDVTVLGAFQVSITGDLANWSTGDSSALPSPGGAMDLVVGAKQVFCMMNLFGRDNVSKLVAQCNLPLTGSAVVKKLYTDFAVFDLSGDTPVVLELVPNVTLEALSERLNLKLVASVNGVREYLHEF